MAGGSGSYTFVICDGCHGSGKLLFEEVVNHHHNEKETWEETCDACGGYGRFLRRTYIRKLTVKDLKLKKRS